MSIEDPYFVVRDEVNTAEAACAKKLVQWREVMQVKVINNYKTTIIRLHLYFKSPSSRAAVARDLTSELRSNVRSAEWDLEDLEESVK